MQASVLIGLFTLILVVSLAAAPRKVSVESFFGGASAAGRAPGLWVLVLSQVTTWIFARSLMNAAILGYYYGMAGTLAYAGYYLSFLTGGFIVGRLRRAGARSVQDWLSGQFGRAGTVSYGFVIALRLLSEVFANLLVVGLIFDAVLGGGAAVAICVTAAVGLAYSAWGGLSAALRTDVMQMSVFFAVFGAALLALLLSPEFDMGAVVRAPGVSGSYAGWVLLAVAGLQVFSYPAHDPVMMDRGFLADEAVTRASFLHAFWISLLCIIGFGLFGIQAGVIGAENENQLLGTWAGMFPPWLFCALMLSLLISALSTLDSALSSAARLVVEDWQFLPRKVGSGRWVMLVFMALGAGLTLWGNATLFDAVAVSGTASMFLTPVLVFGLVLGRRVARWSYVAAFGAAMLGAMIYFGRSWGWIAEILPQGHKYEQLLVICLAVLLAGFASVVAGLRRG
ncbi:MAG: sodium:proline symporter [Sulfitobacter sp.]